MPRRTPADNKTQPAATDVAEFLNGVEHAGRREDSLALVEIMSRVTGEPATMWGASIVGFGRYHYVYDSGREGDHFLTGFAPRKANLVIYIVPGFDNYEALLQKIGKHKTGSSCLYLGRLANVDRPVLETLIERSVLDMRKKYKTGKKKA